MINLFRKMFQRKSPKSSLSAKGEALSGESVKTNVTPPREPSPVKLVPKIDSKPRLSIGPSVRASYSMTLRESGSDWEDEDLITIKGTSRSSFNTNTPSEIEMNGSEGGSKRLEKEQKTHQYYRSRRMERIAMRMAAEENAFKEGKELRLRLIERHREKFEFETKAKVSGTVYPRKISITGTSHQDLSEGSKKKAEAIEKKNLETIENLIERKPQMFLGDLQILSDISSGKFSRVLYAIRYKEGEMNEHIIKVREKNVRMWRSFKLELRILEKTSFSDHPFVVQVFNFLQTKGHLCIIMEFMNGGTLKAQLIQEKKFAEYRSLFYSSCILQALAFLHDLDIVHKGITSENIMLDKEGYAKLSGFDSSLILSRKLPEYDKLGVSNFEQKLLDLRQLAHLLHLMISGKHLETFPHPKVDKRLSSMAEEAIHNIFSLKPQNFASALEVSAFPFFKQINWSKLSEKAIKPPEYRRLSVVDNSPEKTFETLKSSPLIRNAPYERYFDKGYVWKMG